MIEVNVHHRHTGERMQSHIFPSINKANVWINKYNSGAESHQLRLRTLAEKPKSKLSFWAIAIPLGLTAIGICYLILHK